MTRDVWNTDEYFRSATAIDEVASSLSQPPLAAERLAHHLAGLTRSRVVIIAAYRPMGNGLYQGPVFLGDIGWTDDLERRLALRTLTPFATRCAPLDVLLTRGRGTIATAPDRELYIDPGEFDSQYWSAALKALSFDQFLLSRRISPELTPWIPVWILTRASGSEPYSEHDRELVNFVHTAVGEWFYHAQRHRLLRAGGPGAQTPDAGLDSLGRAERVTFSMLLEGLNKQQIAMRLGRSPHTIHHHVKAIYLKVGVTSRVELLLRFGPSAERPAAPRVNGARPGPGPTLPHDEIASPS